MSAYIWFAAFAAAAVLLDIAVEAYSDLAAELREERARTERFAARVVELEAERDPELHDRLWCEQRERDFR